METTTLTLQIPLQQYEKLLQLARNRQLDITEIAEVAIVEWLERQVRLAHGRALMRELGKGLGKSSGASDISRRHDDYLYPPKAS